MILRLHCLFHSFQMVKLFSISKCSFNVLTTNIIKNEQFHKRISVIGYKLFHAEDGSKVTGESSNSIDSSKKSRTIATNNHILLILSDKEILNTTLQDAEQIASQKSLNLVKVIDFDAKMKKPLYKLMTKSQFFIEKAQFKALKSSKNTSAIKSKKFFSLTTKITQHDLDTKIKQALKHIQKNREVQISVSIDGNPSRAEEIAKSIEEELSDISNQRSSIKKKTAHVLIFVPKIEQENIVKDVKNEETNLDNVEKGKL